MIRITDILDKVTETGITFITHTALEADVQATLRGLRDLDAVTRVGAVVRVIGD